MGESHHDMEVDARLESSLHPKRLMVYESRPGSNLVFGSVTLKNEPNARGDVEAIVVGLGVDLVVTHSEALSDGRLSWSFIGSSEQALDLRRAKEALSGSPMVVESAFSLGEGGLVVDRHHFPLWLAEGQRAVVFPPELFHAMFERTRAALGAGADVVAYEQGKAAGSEGLKILLRGVPLQVVKEMGPQVLGMFMAMGWGVITDMAMEGYGPTFVLTVKDNFEAAGRVSERPSCQFMRGLLESALGSVLGREFKCTERKCASTGDPVCEFVLD